MTKALLCGLALLAAVTLGWTRARAESGTMIAAGELAWVEMSPGSPVKFVVLWGDRNKGEYAMLLKLPAGFVAPIHAHTGEYHGLNVSGTWRHSFEGGEERTLPPGSYVFQPGMGMHGDACVGPEDCILLVHQYVKGDFIPKQ
jgi:quercetin dioxygenase-like cupin family protein